MIIRTIVLNYILSLTICLLFHLHRYSSYIFYKPTMAFLHILSLFITASLITAKLQQVVSIFRHGARYHINDYYDGNSTRELWGELTPIGMRQHENLGKMLRRDYINNLKFLTDQYTYNSIEVFSTDVNRTMESVRSQLYGLYPLGYGSKMITVPKEYHLPPFDNQTDSSQQIFALPEGHLPFIININKDIIMTDCNNWGSLTKKNIDSQKLVFDEMIITYQPFMRKIGQMFNIEPDVMNISKISDIYDTLTVDKFLGRPVPADLTDEDYLNMKHIYYWYSYFRISFNLSKAINTGKLNRILADFDGRINNPEQELKWTFLSAHDDDISAMLLDLNMSSAQCVEQVYRYGKSEALNCDPVLDYASNMIFQLHSEGSNYLVKIRHNGKYMYLCERKSTSYPYEEWKARAKTIILNNINDVCGGISSSTNEQEHLFIKT